MRFYECTRFLVSVITILHIHVQHLILFFIANIYHPFLYCQHLAKPFLVYYWQSLRPYQPNHLRLLWDQSHKAHTQIHNRFRQLVTQYFNTRQTKVHRCLITLLFVVNKTIYYGTTVNLTTTNHELYKLLHARIINTSKNNLRIVFQAKQSTVLFGRLWQHCNSKRRGEEEA